MNKWKCVKCGVTDPQVHFEDGDWMCLDCVNTLVYIGSEVRLRE